ncbi:hypothetical protein ACMBCM_09850, partial [Spiroplasma sp. K1]
MVLDLIDIRICAWLNFTIRRNFKSANLLLLLLLLLLLSNSCYLITFAGFSLSILTTYCLWKRLILSG